MSKRDLLEKLQDPEYRNEFISSEIEVGLPMQIRAMREQRGWKQSFVAEKTGTKQPRFSLMEKPGYGNFSLNTLKKLASLFDVGLIVSFVPWGEMIDFVESMSYRRLSILPFHNEQKLLSARHSRERRINTNDDRQLSIVFSTGTVLQYPKPVSLTSTGYEEVKSTKKSVQVSPELSETVGAAYLASINSAGGGVYAAV